MRILYGVDRLLTANWVRVLGLFGLWMLVNRTSIIWDNYYEK